MESEILNLIQTDQKTREAVEEAHRMKFELKRKIADTEKQISEDAWKEVHQRVDAKKAELDYQISQVESENLKEYEQELKRLQARFQIFCGDPVSLSFCGKGVKWPDLHNLIAFA